MMNKYKKIVIKLFSLFFLLINLIISMNYVVDPYGYNSRDNKFIKNLKTKREFVMNKYSYYSQKLIKLNKNDKIKNSKYKG